MLNYHQAWNGANFWLNAGSLISTNAYEGLLSALAASAGFFNAAIYVLWYEIYVRLFSRTYFSNYPLCIGSVLC